ncbi:hypothetical protein BLNAU_18131 [Blattamonas nauphoetae]|uniref:Protein kinase domain-containing protein n=1 Tax=Blattamonas nauphoetae TaxID=2049346 RepID=A0ABQ9X556_9EUKA|nr:hypothetical protein BLNAU_18131 [Blattamonas nauphoetae]
MNSFLVIVTVLFSTKSHIPDTPVSLLSLLSTDNGTRMVVDCLETKFLRLVDNVVISSSIEIRSEEMTLIGNSSILLFQRDIHPSSAPSSWSPNEASTKVEQKQTPKVGSYGLSAAAFMFEVLNSTFSMSKVHAILNSERCGVCLVVASTVRYLSSSITSTGDSSPFMVRMSSDEDMNLGSTIILCSVTLHSKSDRLAPFVGLDGAHTSLTSSPSLDWSASTNIAESITVVGTDLSLESTHLIGGTGPLFSFGLTEQASPLAASGCAIRMETSLVESTLVNVTSSFSFSPSKQLFESGVSQLVVGSWVESCTNHDSGTGMMSPNLGGNLVCLNTSFSSCIRQTNEDLNFSFENITQTHIGRLKTVKSDVTSVTFTLSTFNEMTVTAGRYEGGAAIFLKDPSSSLTISTCFFHKCSCTYTDQGGGAIKYHYSSYNGHPFSLSDSSFTECSTSATAGSVFAEFSSSISIDRCFFELSSALSVGGAYLFTHIITVSNSAFVECSARQRAGALQPEGITSLSLSFVQFRGCSSDIYFSGAGCQLTRYMFILCDSTSGPYGDLIAQISSTPIIIEITISFDGDQAIVTVETDEAIQGTMNVLLDGSNVPRLVHVLFGDPSQLTKVSKVGTAIVSSGTNGILPSAEYTLRNSTLTPFPPPTIQSVETTVNDWNTTEFELKGVRLEEGKYWMLIESKAKTVKEWNISLTLSESDTLTGSAPLFPSTAEGRLDWATNYEVMKVIWRHPDGLTEEEPFLSKNFTFSTPKEPIRITSADCSLDGDEQKSALIVLAGTMSGYSNYFSMTFRKMEGSTPTGDEIELSGYLSITSSSTAQTSSVLIFGTTNPLLSFGTKYLITKFAFPNMLCLLPAGVTFSVPAEPPRIEEAKCTLNGKKDMLIVELSGSALSSSGQAVVISGSSENIKSSGGLFDVTWTKCFVNFSIGSNEDDSHVVFGGRYKVLSAGADSSSVIVKTGLSIEVPHPPRITSIVVPKEISTSTFDLSVSGSNLQSDKTYTVKLTCGLTFDILFSSTSAGSSTIPIGGSGYVQYDTEYTIESIIRKENVKDDEHILFSESTFTTPLGPTLSSISCDFLSSNPDFVQVSFSTTRMPTEDFTLTLTTTQTPSETIPLTITPANLSAGFVLVEVYKKTNSLKYGTEYSVSGMKSSSVSAAVLTQPFSTPDAPFRITSADCSLGGDKQKSALVTPKGVKLGGGKDFNVTVWKMKGTTPTGSGIVLRGTLSGASSSTTHTLSVLIYGTPNPLLSFETTYLITQFEVDGEVSVVDVDASFTIPPEPPRIVGMETRRLTKDRTKMIVSLDGSALLARTGMVSLTGGNTNCDLLSDVTIKNNTHCTAEFAVGTEETSDQLKFGEEYALKGSWTESSGFLTEDGITIVVPLPPTITKMEFIFSNTLHTVCFVTFTGTDLIVGSSLNVTLNNSLSFIVTITSETEAKSSEMQIGWPTTLQHNTKYQITSIEAMDEDDGETLFDSAVSDTTGPLAHPFVVYIDSGSSSDSSLFCGDFNRPCASIEDGWEIVEGIEILSLSISIVHNTTQTDPIRLLSPHDVVIESGPSTKPELFVSPSSLSELDGEGMVDVSGGRLWIHQVDVVLSDSPSLIFIRMVGGHLTIEMCSFTGHSSSPPSNLETNSDLCLWESGILNLMDATTTITSTQLCHLSQGAIKMKGGDLTIRSSSFDSNTPKSSPFPSLHHNLICSEGGEIEIGSLSGGDGSKDLPSAWISADECTLASTLVDSAKSFFIPTLSSSSTSKLNTEKTGFEVSIEGTTLIPCSLFLEVFEISKEGKEGMKDQRPLTDDSTKSFTETNIELSLPLSSLSKLDPSLEWRGRLAFGKDEITTTSFVIQKNAAERRSQAVKENMNWLLPLVISLSLLFLILLVVAIVCCRRKNHKQNKIPDQPRQEMDVEDKVEVEFETDSVRDATSAEHIGLRTNQTWADNKTDGIDSSAANATQLGFVEALHCGMVFEIRTVPKTETLFKRLHEDKKPLSSRRVTQIALARGLQHLSTARAECDIFAKLTSHWILIGGDETVNLKVGEDTSARKVTPAARTVVGEESKRGPVVSNEGQRWQAPEQGKQDTPIDIHQAAVFRLGLVLWEIETGLMPFGETDAVNAHRHLAIGTLPPMDRVRNAQMQELIESCLSLDPNNRPSFNTLVSSLECILPDSNDNTHTFIS